MDCLFITSSKTGLVQFSIYPFLGVGYLSSLLKQQNISTQLFDADINTKLSEILEVIETTKPLVVAYSIMSISLPFYYKLTRLIHSKFPKQIIVAGGPHVTNDPQIVFELNIDYGFVGYSEESFPLFMTKIKKGEKDFEDVKGLVIKATGRIDSPSFYDISDSYICPDYDLYDVKKYQNISYGKNWFTIISSRGCPGNCKFCKNPGKNKYKEYPIESIKNQIEILVKKYNVEWLTFVDDSFTYNRNRVIELCKWIIEQGFTFKWTCMTRAELLDTELILLMKQAGLDYVIIGVESGDEDVRKRINKFITNKVYCEAVSELRKNKVRVLCSYIYGNVDESNREMWQTIKFALKLNSDYAQFYNMIALPDTPIFKLAIKENKLSSDSWYKYMRSESRMPYYSSQSGKFFAKFLKILSFFIYYAKPSRFFDLGFRFVRFYKYIYSMKRSSKNKFQNINKSSESTF
jgi:radical SAM superfamily enzyme YgiQ (UPF0313 family)